MLIHAAHAAVARSLLTARVATALHLLPIASRFRKRDDAAAVCGPMVPAWKWNLGRALLPFTFRVDAGRRHDGSGMLSWHASNISMIRRYNQLHVKREDERYCTELPCGGVFRSTTACWSQVT